MGLAFYNTLTRQKAEFAPDQPGHVRMYTCGPTIHDFVHIGNFRTFVFEDLLRRYLKYKGLKVTQVMNLTDIDDKIIKKKTAEGISLSEYTTRYRRAFFDDLDILNIEHSEHYPAATEYIDEMVTMIQALEQNGYAYNIDGNWYFRIQKFPDYGKLAGIRTDELQMGARVASDEYEKEQVGDFALWKAWDEGDDDVFWETPLGKGRPGWSIECSAMSTAILGNHFDIHTGGVDNIFPHHVNEIAQSEGATGEKFVNVWLHSAHLIVEGQKMSKSLGNFFTLRDLVEKGYSPKAIRYLLMATHYRQQVNFTFDSLGAAAEALQRLYDFIDNVTSSTMKTMTPNPEITASVEKVQNRFEEALDDDLNISPALGAIFDFVREVNRILTKGKLAYEDGRVVLDTMDRFDTVLGLLKREEVTLDDHVEQLITLREQARREKNWPRSDELREELSKLGIILEDTPDGTKWKRKVQ
jgi:cysteinyl-tRNA synthetase